MKKILIVSVNWLGDAIMLAPACQAIKQTYPDAYIGVMAPKRVCQIFSDNPAVNQVLEFDEKGRQRNIFDLVKFVLFLRRQKYDTVFLVHRSFTRAFICFLAGIKNRIGFKRKKTDWILTKKVDSNVTDIHRQDLYLSLFEQSGIKINDRQSKIFICPEDLKKAQDLIKEIKLKHQYVVGVNVTANWDLKRWPKENFAYLADRLIKELNCACLFIGAKNDMISVNQVIRLMKEKPYNLCGQTSLTELGAIIRSCDIFVSSDSGPAHLSAAVGTKTLVLFGPTSCELTAPRLNTVTIIKKDINCVIPCYNLKCDENICMQKISVDEVFNQIKQLLKVT